MSSAMWCFRSLTLSDWLTPPTQLRVRGLRSGRRADCRPLLDEWDWLRPWVPILVDVLDHEQEWWDGIPADGSVLLGVEPDQLPLACWREATDHAGIST
jgi:hypothetical protein